MWSNSNYGNDQRLRQHSHGILLSLQHLSNTVFHSHQCFLLMNNYCRTAHTKIMLPLLLSEYQTPWLNSSIHLMRNAWCFLESFREFTYPSRKKEHSFGFLTFIWAFFLHHRQNDPLSMSIIICSPWWWLVVVPVWFFFWIENDQPAPKNTPLRAVVELICRIVQAKEAIRTI